MKDEDIRQTFIRVVECLTAVTAKQSLLCELLARGLPALESSDRETLRHSADVNLQLLKNLQATLTALAKDESAALTRPARSETSPPSHSSTPWVNN